MKACRAAVVWLVGPALAATSTGSAQEVLDRAYEALRNRRFDAAVALFREGVALAPSRASVRKDFAYLYLKVGEPDAARDQFGEAMRLDPEDHHAALEYAFLCFETRRQAEARRVFDRVRQTGDAASRATAEQAFGNIDGPLAAGIRRWKRVVAEQPEDFTAHHELAGLAEQRDELDLAAKHYRLAWQLKPERRSYLVDLGRTLLAAGRLEEANAALLAASRGGEPHAAQAAQELLPSRYPFVYEFEAALALDPANVELRRELAYLHLRMDRREQAEAQFAVITSSAPGDLLSAAQLGFLYLSKDRDLAMPLLERVLNGPDEDLANRVRAVLQMPQILRKRSGVRAETIEAKLMAERSWKAGYLKDALKYLHIAHEADPVDFSVMLRLGWVYNLLKQDANALGWFQLAKKSPDPAISQEAAKAYGGLRRGLGSFRTTAWAFPLFSSRWRDLFSYGQAKLEWKPQLAVRPYLSVRFAGDARGSIGAGAPQYLSESAAIFAVGAGTRAWHGLTAWGEAGRAVGYRRLTDGPRTRADYRGGLAFGRAWGVAIGGEKRGWSFSTNADGVFLSRFGNDVLAVWQSRAGYGGGGAQFVWNWNLTADTKREYWANFVETGPGLRLRVAGAPLISVDLLRGAYTRNEANPRRPNFFDFRTGVWYAFTY